MRSFVIATSAALALWLGHAAAQADTVKFTAALAPDPQAPTKSSGQGSANLSVDTATKTLTGTIEYSSLSAPPQVAAFLSPPPKQNAPPGTVPIPLQAGAASPINISMKLTDAQIAGLKSGQWMLLIGTQQAPEIGGEVKPAQ
ncbi:MAG TPA: CHRD domain-containing protein [Stellaceae bacterium]|nr:CHRD domain-containing protein [Stellaceae bacterium]